MKQSTAGILLAIILGLGLLSALTSCKPRPFSPGVDKPMPHNNTEVLDVKVVTLSHPQTVIVMQVNGGDLNFLDVNDTITMWKGRSPKAEWKFDNNPAYGRDSVDADGIQYKTVRVIRLPGNESSDM